MVSQGKPAPDLFLYVAKMMDYLPDQCWVIEDSVAGIQAARAAGMRCIGFLGGSHAQYSWYREGIENENPFAICDEMKSVKNIIYQNSI